MDTECDGTVVQDINEQHSQCQSCNWRLNQGDPQEPAATEGTEFMPETQIQLKDIEEIQDEDDFGKGELFVDPKKCPSELEDVEHGKAGVDNVDGDFPEAIVAGRGRERGEESELQEPEEDPENGSEETISREWRKVRVRDVSDGGMKKSRVKDTGHLRLIASPAHNIQH